MINVLWATHQYWVWLVAISLFCFLLERLWPWRERQRPFRKQFTQDLIWLVLNGHYVGIAVAFAGDHLLRSAFPALGQLRELELLGAQPWWLQFVVFFLFKDLLEWGVHNLLHRVPILWHFHKLHHSIEELDWIGNFRFHWMEVVIYKSLTYLPLVILGVDGSVILAIAVVTTLIGDLNHSNLNLTWGPFRYLLNSPRMHVWHHMKDLPAEHPRGVNFGIGLSVWDWLFGTAYWPDREQAPEQQPDALGFSDMDQYPRGFIARFVHPFVRLGRRRASAGVSVTDETRDASR